MEARYGIHPDVVDDLAEIVAYIAEFSVESAERVLDDIEATFDLIAKNPGIGRPADAGFGSQGVRVHPVRRYLIFYNADMRPIRIAGVIHGMRSPDTIQSLLRSRENDPN